MTLDELAIKHSTDKSSEFHGYTKIYERLFEKFKNLPITLLEIGVWKGASLKMWDSFFPKAKIIGLDNENHLRDNEYDVYIGDQKDPKIRDNIIKDTGDLDIVIDDGGHKHSEQIASFELFFPHLKSGGLYVIEDVGTSYWRRKKWWGGSRTSTIEYLKNMIDHVNIFGKLKFAYLMKKKDLPPECRKDIFSITFFRYLCVIEKI